MEYTVICRSEICNKDQLRRGCNDPYVVLKNATRWTEWCPKCGSAVISYRGEVMKNMKKKKMKQMLSESGVK